jgi:HSP20 family protein
MKLVRSDDARKMFSPWWGLTSIFDDDFMVDTSTQGGINMWEDDSSVYVEVAVPGLKEKDLDVNLENGVLTVRGVKEDKDEQKQGKRVYSSSMKQSFYYSTTLPSNVDSGKVNAELEDGVLTLRVEKSPEAKPKKIEVKRKLKQ